MTNTMKTINARAKLFVVLISSSIIIACSNGDQGLRFTTFQTSAGWGYTILVNDTIFIHQEVAPALATPRGFTTEQQAKKAAKMVLKKMRTHQFPSLSINEVQSIMNETKLR